MRTVISLLPLEFFSFHIGLSMRVVLHYKVGN